MIRSVKLLVIFLLIVAASAVPAAAQTLVADTIPKHIRRGAVGLKFGVVNTGEMEIDSVTLDPNPGWNIELWFDVPLFGRTMVTAAVDVYDFRFNEESERFIDVSLGLRRVIYMHDQALAWKPGAAVGLGYLADVGFMRPTTYVTAKANLELMMFTDNPHAFVFDIGVVGMPRGGNSTLDVSIAPSLFLRVGLSY